MLTVPSRSSSRTAATGCPIHRGCRKKATKDQDGGECAGSLGARKVRWRQCP